MRGGERNELSGTNDIDEHVMIFGWFSDNHIMYNLFNFLPTSMMSRDRLIDALLKNHRQRVEQSTSPDDSSAEHVSGIFGASIR